MVVNVDRVEKWLKIFVEFEKIGKFVELKKICGKPLEIKNEGKCQWSRESGRKFRQI